MITNDNVPIPTVMPVDREQWATQLNITNFINTYYQYRDLQLLGSGKRLLIVGPGQGFEALVFEWRGYNVTTFDIDETFNPDYVGSVHDMKMFGDGQFDAVIASHVLEHLAVPYLDMALSEIARVGRNALIYVPVHGRHLQVRLIPGFRNLNLSMLFDIFNPLKRPDGVTPRYMAGQHFWEVGMRGFRVRNLLHRMSRFFEVLLVYRNRDWNLSQNFVLRSQRRSD